MADTFFDRVVVVSLERRRDRLDEFFDRVPSDFPFGEIEIFHAIDGKQCRHPSWWRGGGGAWGCYRSHVNIIEAAITDGVKRLLIFEDDATFAEGFAAKSREYVAALPADWQQAYFGGQHLKRPFEVPGNEKVVAAANINRTHAYAVNGKEAMTVLYKWLHERDHWKGAHHIDHHYGRLHKITASGFYAPTEWLCGQAAGRSDIAQRLTEERIWARTRTPAKRRPQPARPVPKPKRRQMENSKPQTPFYAVIGLHRSGSSCTASMCHKLGLNMGDKLTGYEGRNGGGGEAVGLMGLCEWAAMFPSVGFNRPEEKVLERLRRWIFQRMKKSAAGGFPVGGKYPTMCAMGGMLQTICGDNLRVIHCVRPLEESIASLKRRSRKSTGFLAASDRQCERVQEWLWEEKNRLISSLPKSSIMDVEYARTLESPEDVASEIAEFCGLPTSGSSIAAAAAHVKKR
jgi:hypothetical protein